MWCLSHTGNECVHLAEEGDSLNEALLQGKTTNLLDKRKSTALFQEILLPLALILQQNVNKYSDAFIQSHRVPDSFVKIKRSKC